MEYTLYSRLQFYRELNRSNILNYFQLFNSIKPSFFHRYCTDLVPTYISINKTLFIIRRELSLNAQYIALIKYLIILINNSLNQNLKHTLYLYVHMYTFTTFVP